MARQVALTTEDNPYSPFTQFDEWYAFDELKGYHSCSLLARIFDLVNVNNEELTNDNSYLVEESIDRIVNLNALGIYKKVVNET